MAWIESHQDLERHPKTLKLKASLGVSLEHTLGSLHRLWYWALSYAEDGNLDKYGLQGVTEVVGFNAQLLIDSGWIDDKPYLRIHDWWDYIGRFLRTKYKNYPNKWQTVERRYLGRTKAAPKGMSKPQLPNLPNLTNQPKNKDVCSEPQKDVVSEPTEPPLMVFQTKGNTKTWPLTKEVFRTFEEGFPGIDVLSECKKALVWVQMNPSKAKTSRGMGKFLFGWIERSNNNGKSRRPEPKKEFVI